MNNLALQTHDLQRLQVQGNNLTIMTATYTGAKYEGCGPPVESTRTKSFPSNAVETVQCEGGTNCYHLSVDCCGCPAPGPPMRLMDHPNFQIASVASAGSTETGGQQPEAPVMATMERVRAEGRTFAFQVESSTPPVKQSRPVTIGPVEVTLEEEKNSSLWLSFLGSVLHENRKGTYVRLHPRCFVLYADGSAPYINTLLG